MHVYDLVSRMVRRAINIANNGMSGRSPFSVFYLLPEESWQQGFESMYIFQQEPSEQHGTVLNKRMVYK